MFGALLLERHFLTPRTWRERRNTMSNRRKKKKTQGFKYTKLKDLNQGREVNVVGVVSSFASSQRISDGFVCGVTLIDESKLEVDCSMFHKDRNSLPPQLYPGDIVCLKGGAVENRAPHITLKMNTGSGWAVFRKNVGYKQLPCSEEYRVVAGSTEDARVEELRKWSTADVAMASPAASSLDQMGVVPGSHKCSSTHLSTPIAAHNNSAASNTPSARSPHPGTPLAPRTLNSGLPRPSPRMSGLPQTPVSRPASGRYYDSHLSTIRDLVIGSKDAGVIGVVKYFKPPLRSKGKDCYTVLCIIDSSTSDSSGLTCIIFNPVRENLPIVCACGEVVMVKGLHISTFDGARQARGHDNTLVGVFPMDVKCPTPETIGNFYTMKTSEKTSLLDLRSWAATKSVPLLINSQMEELSPGSYCSTVCLVLAVFKPRPGSGGIILVVTDGTSPKHPSSINAEELEVLQCSLSSYYMYHSLSCVVNVTTASRPAVNPGDVVQLVNVRMIEKSRGPAPLPVASSPSGSRPDGVFEELTVEVLVEDHDRYQGAVKVNSHDSELAQDFRKALPVPEGPHPISKEVDSQLVVSTRLLLNDVRESTLAQIQSPDSVIGSTHEVTVQVVGVGRGAWSRLEDMTQLRCPACLTLYLSPQPSMENCSELVDAGDPCVCCGEEGGESELLCYMYAFPLLVADATSELEVAVSGSEGSRFMLRSPVNLYCDSSARDDLLDLLYLLTGGNDPFHHVPLGPCYSQPRPHIKVGVTVIKTCSGLRRYQITGTVLQVDKA